MSISYFLIMEFTDSILLIYYDFLTQFQGNAKRNVSVLLTALAFNTLYSIIV